MSMYYSQRSGEVGGDAAGALLLQSYGPIVQNRNKSGAL